MARFATIFPAAGRSSRFGGHDKKPFVPLAGRPIWLRTVVRFLQRSDVVQALLVLSPDDVDLFRERFRDELAMLPIEIVPGGAERFESVANALARLTPDVEYVAVHDAVRPCVSDECLEAVFAKAVETGAAMLAVPVADTVKRVDAAGRVTETVPRQGLWLAQTPQVFRRDWLEAAYAQRGRLGRAITDDAQLVEAAGHAVHVVAGESTNLKITTPADLLVAEAALLAEAVAREPLPAEGSGEPR